MEREFRNRIMGFNAYLALLALCLVFLFVPYFKMTAKLILILAVYAALVYKIAAGKTINFAQMFPGGKTLLAIWLFIIVAGVTALFSQDAYLSQRVISGRFIYYLILFGLGSWLATLDKRFYLCLSGAVLFSGIIIASGAVWQYFNFGLGAEYRLWDSFGRQLDIAGWVSLMLPFSLGLILFEENKSLRVLALFAFFLLLFPWVLHRSRFAWTAVFFAGVFLIFLKAHRHDLFKQKKQIYILFSLIVFIVCGVYSILPYAYKARLKTIPLSNTWSGRLTIWQQARPLIKDYPWLGIGPGCSELVIGKYPGYAYPRLVEGNILHFHNNYIEVLVEMGWIGLLFFLNIFFSFFRLFFLKVKYFNSQSLPPLALTVSAVTVAMLFSAVVGGVFTSGTSVAIVYWLLFGFACGQLELMKANKAENTAILK